MLSAKKVNKHVLQMYKGKPYIETTITLYTPLENNKELHQKLSGLMGNIAPTMEGINNEVEETIGEMFESDVASVYSGVKNL